MRNCKNAASAKRGAALRFPIAAGKATGDARPHRQGEATVFVGALLLCFGAEQRRTFRMGEKAAVRPMENFGADNDKPAPQKREAALRFPHRRGEGGGG